MTRAAYMGSIGGRRRPRPIAEAMAWMTPHNQVIYASNISAWLQVNIASQVVDRDLVDASEGFVIAASYATPQSLVGDIYAEGDWV